MGLASAARARGIALRAPELADATDQEPEARELRREIRNYSGQQL